MTKRQQKKIEREELTKTQVLNLLELEKVAKYLGMSLSAFMRMASIEKASKIDVKKEKKIK